MVEKIYEILRVALYMIFRFACVLHTNLKASPTKGIDSKLKIYVQQFLPIKEMYLRPFL